MNKTERMLAIILELQSKGTQRAEDLAATFETSVRTIYRDIQALSEAGVPVAGLPGQGYTLMEGYFLPPVSFTAEEAVAALLGADFVAGQFDEQYRIRAVAARRKIEGILPEPVKVEAERLRAGMRLLTAKKHIIGQEMETLARLRSAILEERRVGFHYEKSGMGTVTERQSVREVDPYGLVLIDGSWVLIGYCHLRKEIRHFRLKRMSEVDLLAQAAKKPTDFDLHAYAPVDDRQLVVKVWADAEIANELRTSPHFYMDELVEQEDGLLVTLRVRQPEEILQWLLGWGAHMKVLEPESLCQRMREELVAMLNHY
ncbi:helix-turn-helix transcriptional regulator [Brevibacillus migulae]|uniref:helix-turn-helix transcriptional regulator n=1 Tax=Brevibacillus migulae TaxID=1644114 RepID=UPI00106E4221|nr:YafY family protein [Brevibacillus migulae]